ncbi:MAG TPA: hypothetical protein VHY56_10830 [Candidatus Binataceae bacterium]|nr:hypothetical protein [Candidatus Binataceae bacterium]
MRKPGIGLAVLRANAVVSKLQLALRVASSAAPGFALKAGRVTFLGGAMVTASATGKTLTVDMTSGSNTSFEVAR